MAVFSELGIDNNVDGFIYSGECFTHNEYSIILVSLIQLGNTMSIYPGAATLAFSGVVVVTMLAVMSFDPRLIWNTST